MDLSTAKSCLHGPLSATEKARCMQLNLCLYCGGEGHRASDCTAKPPTQMQLRQTSFEYVQLEGVDESKNE